MRPQQCLTIPGSTGTLNSMLEQINSYIYWVLIGVLVFNLMQRKHTATAQKKRMGTLLVAILILMTNLLFSLILMYELPDSLAFLALAAVAMVGFVFRSRLEIFKLRCPECGTRLDFHSFLHIDSSLCASCRNEGGEEHLHGEAEEEKKHPKDASDVEEIDWELWEPDETAVICYIVKDGSVLLIHKKTGLGKGKVNAPGGRIKDDETAREAAVRETQEETGITPLDPEHRGILNFQFTNGYALRGHVFYAENFSGEPKNTDEADPFWVPVEQMPYESMWEDDQHWLPKVLSGDRIEGFFLFDESRMVSKEIKTDTEAISCPTAYDAE